MPSSVQIDQSSVTDNDVARQVEFVGEVDGEEYDFAVKYSVLKELSGDEPDDDALETFERFGDESLEVCADVLASRSPATVIVIDESDFE